MLGSELCTSVYPTENSTNVHFYSQKKKRINNSNLVKVVIAKCLGIEKTPSERNDKNFVLL